MNQLFIVVAVLVSLIPCLVEIAPGAEGMPPASLYGGGMKKIVVARVNGVEITMESIAMMMNSLGTKRRHEPVSPNSMEDTRKEALDQLILQELAVQKARSEGLAAEPHEIDDVLGDMRQKLGGEEKFREFIEKERITEEELRNRIERNLTLKRILKKEVLDKVSVSEEGIRKTYENEKEIYSKPEKIAIVDVVFFLETGDADSLKKAEETLKKLHDDQEKNPWNLVSDGTFAVRDMETKDIREIELYDMAKTVKAGELSGVFPVAGNFHIIKLKEYSPRKQFSFEEVKSGIEGKLKAQAREKRLEEWGATLRKGAKIEIVETGGSKK